MYQNYDLADDLTVAEIHFNMGIVYCETGALSKSIDSYEISMRLRREILGDDNVEIAQVSCLD